MPSSSAVTTTAAAVAGLLHLLRHRNPPSPHNVAGLGLPPPNPLTMAASTAITTNLLSSRSPKPLTMVVRCSSSVHPSPPEAAPPSAATVSPSSLSRTPTPNPLSSSSRNPKPTTRGWSSSPPSTASRSSSPPSTPNPSRRRRRARLSRRQCSHGKHRCRRGARCRLRPPPLPPAAEYALVPPPAADVIFFKVGDPCEGKGGEKFPERRSMRTLSVRRPSRRPSPPRTSATSRTPSGSASPSNLRENWDLREKKEGEEKREEEERREQVVGTEKWRRERERED